MISHHVLHEGSGSRKQRQPMTGLMGNVKELE